VWWFNVALTANHKQLRHHLLDRFQVCHISSPWTVKISNVTPPFLPERNSYCFALIQSHLETANGCRSFSWDIFKLPDLVQSTATTILSPPFLQFLYNDRATSPHQTYSLNIGLLICCRLSESIPYRFRVIDLQSEADHTETTLQFSETEPRNCRLLRQL
jgi:hypothetical protein